MKKLAKALSLLLVLFVLFGVSVSAGASEKVYDFSSATELPLGVVTNGSIAASEPGSSSGTLFTFTPQKTGYYRIITTGGYCVDDCYEQQTGASGIGNGEENCFHLHGALPTSEDDYSYWAYWHSEFFWPNFGLITSFIGGWTYYLYVGSYASGDFTVLLEEFDAEVNLSSNRMSVKVGEDFTIDALLEGSGYTTDDIYMYLPAGAIDRRGIYVNVEDFYGKEPGQGWVYLYMKDGKVADIEVTVVDTTVPNPKKWYEVNVFIYWLVRIFMLGFIWM